MTALTVQEFGNKLNKMDEQFKSALPEHISVERFKRTAMTALQQDSDLLNCQVKSVLTALTLCAADGLLPNRREAALVIYNNRREGTKSAQYMPMIAGVRKRMYNSGEIESIDAQVVRENDSFDYELGDNPRIIHKPALENRGDLRLAYCVVKLCYTVPLKLYLFHPMLKNSYAMV